MTATLEIVASDMCAQRRLKSSIYTILSISFNFPLKTKYLKAQMLSVGLFSHFILFLVSLLVVVLCLVDPVWNFDHIFGEERAGCITFLWFVVCILSVIVCLLVLLVSG